MQLRPYRKSDAKYIMQWTKDKRIHALWSANTIPYGFTEEEFEACLARIEEQWFADAFIATDEKGIPAGFFAFSVDIPEKSGFLRYIVLDEARRGQGMGRQMLELAVRYAFTAAGADKVKLIVFDVNQAARNCYAKVGFTDTGYKLPEYHTEEEVWQRCELEIVKKI